MRYGTVGYRSSRSPQMTADELLTAVLNYNTNIVRIDQVRHGPPIQIVLGHALFGEALVFRGLSQVLRHHQCLKPDALVITEVVPLVELMPAAEFGTPGVPHQLHT